MKNYLFNLFFGVSMIFFSFCHAENIRSNNLVELKKKLELAEIKMLENPTDVNVKKYRDLTIECVEIASKIAKDYHNNGNKPRTD